ncbi:MAG: MFS transporter [Granulosicoccaceae bacterium]
MQDTLQFVRDNTRWLLGGFLLTFFSSFGQTFFISLSGAEIRGEYGLSHGEFGGLYMLATLASAATLPSLGRVVDIISVARTIALIVPMLVLATASMALAHSIWGLLLSLYMLRLFGQGMMSHTAMTAMGRWYSAHRGRAVSLVALGHQCGEAILPILAISLFASFGWRISWLLAGAALLLLALPLIYLLMRVERTPQQSDKAVDLSLEPRRHWRREDVLRDGLFWRLTLAVLAPSFISTAIFFHQDYLLTLRGWPAESFAQAFVLLAGITVCSALIAGQLIDKFSGVSLLPYFLLPLAMGCLTIGVVEAEFGIYLFMGLMGVSYGMSSVLYGAIWPELYGTQHLGSIRAVITAMMVFSSALGPGVTGWLIDLGVDYGHQMLVLGTYCVCVSAMMYSVIKQRQIKLPTAQAPAVR